MYISFTNGDRSRRKVDGTLSTVVIRVQLKHLIASSALVCMWYAPQGAFLMLESTQAHNRSRLSVFILKRKDLLEARVYNKRREPGIKRSIWSV